MITFLVFLVIGILVWTFCLSAAESDKRLNEAIKEEKEKETNNA